jgi:hypothetical protein
VAPVRIITPPPEVELELELESVLDAEVDSAFVEIAKSHAA